LALTLLRGIGKALKGSERKRNLFHPINKPIDNRSTDMVTYNYDNRGRLTSIVYSSPARTITINYDAMGNRTSVVTT
jgi:YD repeat-containing protein